MSRVFWQLFAFLFSAVVGGCVWLVAHMIDLPQAACAILAVFVFLGFSIGMHLFFAENGAPGEPQMREPWTVADKKILNEPYVPQILRRPLDLFEGEEDTAVFDGRYFNLTRPKTSSRVVEDDATHIHNAAEVYGRQGRHQAGAR